MKTKKMKLNYLFALWSVFFIVTSCKGQAKKQEQIKKPKQEVTQLPNEDYDIGEYLSQHFDKVKLQFYNNDGDFIDFSYLPKKLNDPIRDSVLADTIKIRGEVEYVFLHKDGKKGMDKFLNELLPNVENKYTRLESILMFQNVSPEKELAQKFYNSINRNEDFDIYVYYIDAINLESFELLILENEGGYYLNHIDLRQSENEGEEPKNKIYLKKAGEKKFKLLYDKVGIKILFDKPEVEKIINDYEAEFKK